MADPWDFGTPVQAPEPWDLGTPAEALEPWDAGVPVGGDAVGASIGKGLAGAVGGLARLPSQLGERQEQFAAEQEEAERVGDYLYRQGAFPAAYGADSLRSRKYLQRRMFEGFYETFERPPTPQEQQLSERFQDVHWQARNVLFGVVKAGTSGQAAKAREIIESYAQRSPDEQAMFLHTLLMHAKAAMVRPEGLDYVKAKWSFGKRRARATFGEFWSFKRGEPEQRRADLAWKVDALLQAVAEGKDRSFLEKGAAGAAEMLPWMANIAIGQLAGKKLGIGGRAGAFLMGMAQPIQQYKREFREEFGPGNEELAGRLAVTAGLAEMAIELVEMPIIRGAGKGKAGLIKRAAKAILKEWLVEEGLQAAAGGTIKRGGRWWAGIKTPADAQGLGAEILYQLKESLAPVLFMVTGGMTAGKAADLAGIAEPSRRQARQAGLGNAPGRITRKATEALRGLFDKLGWPSAAERSAPVQDVLAEKWAAQLEPPREPLPAQVAGLPERLQRAAAFEQAQEAGVPVAKRLEEAVLPAAERIEPEADDLPVAMEAEDLGPGQIDQGVVALNKKTIEEARAELNLPELDPVERRDFEDVTDEATRSRADEDALRVADEILRTGRQQTDVEHVAAVIKYDKLEKELRAAMAARDLAEARGDAGTRDREAGRVASILDQIDRLTRADDVGGSVNSRALGIRRIRLSREDYSVTSVMRRAQSNKGRRLSSAEQERISQTIADLEKAQEELELAQLENDRKALRIAELEATRRIGAERAKAAKAQEAGKKKLRRQEALKATRADLVRALGEMGLRVNDITGLGAEGLYLIGRLAAIEVQLGAQTLAEVVENVRARLPELSAQHVYEGLQARNPAVQRRVRSDAAKRLARIKSQARLLVQLDEGAQDALPAQKKRVIQPARIRALERTLAKLRKSAYQSEMDREKLEAALATIDKLQDQLRIGREAVEAEPTRELPPELIEARERIRQLKAELSTDQTLRDLQQQLDTGELRVPPERIKKYVSPQLERKQIQVRRLQRKIDQLIEQAKTKEGLAKLYGVAVEAREAQRTALTTMDISFTFRQNVVQVGAHWVRAFLNSGPALKALLSRYSAEQIYNGTQDSPNAIYYDLSGLQVLDPESADHRQRSEVFQSVLVERVPILGQIVQASNRHATTIGNLMRTTGFDAFLKQQPNATREEMTAWADWMNVSTGLGDLGKLGVGRSAEVLRWGLFSAKLGASRFQAPYLLHKYRHLPRIRKAIARDLTRFVATGVGVLSMASFAGAQVVWWPPDDPDWGKIRIGNMRIDIWGGFQQPARMILRIAMTPVDALRGEEVENPLDLLGRFAAFKVSPTIGSTIEALRGKTAVGEEVTLTDTALRSVTPLVIQDIHEAGAEHGLGGAAAAGALAAPGIGVQTYRDSENRTREKIRGYKDGGNFGEARRLQREWNRENPKNRIVTVKTTAQLKKSR